MAKVKSLRERMIEAKKTLKSKGQGSMIFIKEGSIRCRIIPPAGLEDGENFYRGITQFYLGNTIKGVISPATIGKPCAIMEYYESIKGSKDPDEQEIAKELAPKTKNIIRVGVMENSKEPHTGDSGKFILIPSNALMAEIIDLYLDDDDWGEGLISLGKDGYDIKIGREGKGKMDTKYTVTPAPHSKAHPSFSDLAGFDWDTELEKIIPSYQDTVDKLNEFMGSVGTSNDLEDDEDEIPKGLKKKPIGSSKKKLSKSKKSELYDNEDLPF